MSRDYVISIKFSEELLELVDNEVKCGGYTGRSEFVRTAVRDYINAQIDRRIKSEMVSVDISDLDEKRENGKA